MTNEDYRESVLMRLGRVEVSVGEMERRMAAAEMKNAVDEVHRVNVEKRLAGIEGTLVWLVRSIFTAVILAAVAFVVNGGWNIGFGP